MNSFLVVVTVSLLVVSALFVWRLARRPLRGDIHMQLIGRGAAAGVAGGVIGATFSSLLFGAGAYAPIGYLYWLLFTAILGMVFTFIIGAVQRFGVNLNLLARVISGGLIGIVTAGLWAFVVNKGLSSPFNWFGKGLLCMIVGTGIVSGILGGPLDKEV